MELTTKERAVIKMIVERELEQLEKDESKLLISNASFLNKIDEDSDLDFMKVGTEYQLFLTQLLEKL